MENSSTFSRWSNLACFHNFEFFVFSMSAYSSSWKSVKIYRVEWMGLNFDDYLISSLLPTFYIKDQWFTFQIRLYFLYFQGQLIVDIFKVSWLFLFSKYKLTWSDIFWIISAWHLNINGSQDFVSGTGRTNLQRCKFKLNP